MKHVQIIDGALNSIFEVYAVPDQVFARLFPDGADVAFADDFPEDDPVWQGFYANPLDKKTVLGIHGTLHLQGWTEVSRFFPTRKEGEVC